MQTVSRAYWVAATVIYPEVSSRAADFPVYRPLTCDSQVHSPTSCSSSSEYVQPLSCPSHDPNQPKSTEAD
jgi:hypothetical protein